MSAWLPGCSVVPAANGQENQEVLVVAVAGPADRAAVDQSNERRRVHHQELLGTDTKRSDQLAVRRNEN
jgi:hypothetical protein